MRVETSSHLSTNQSCKTTAVTATGKQRGSTYVRAHAGKAALPRTFCARGVGGYAQGGHRSAAGGNAAGSGRTHAATRKQAPGSVSAGRAERPGYSDQWSDPISAGTVIGTVIGRHRQWHTGQASREKQRDSHTHIHSKNHRTVRGE